MSLIRKVFAKVRNPAQFGLTIVAFNYICSKIIKMETIRPNSFKAWLLASRPKTLTAAAIPVMIGCSLAATHGSFQPVPAILCFLFAFIMQINANYINDLYDYLKGSDREDRLGPMRACAQGWITPPEMKKGIIIENNCLQKVLWKNSITSSRTAAR